VPREGAVRVAATRSADLIAIALDRAVESWRETHDEAALRHAIADVLEFLQDG
jgi:hypothetical protein